MEAATARQFENRFFEFVVRGAGGSVFDAIGVIVIGQTIGSDGD